MNPGSNPAAPRLGEDARQEELRDVLRRDVVAGAIRLLGCVIEWPEGRARIVETEAYRGDDDPGCHAFGRPGMKNQALFGAPGTAYVYRSYGIHQMLNVAALPEGRAAGILIRALRPVDGNDDPIGDPTADELRGPGRLARSLGIGPWLNGHDLLDGSNSVRIFRADPRKDLLVGPRIGLSSGKGETIPWRFAVAEDSRWISGTRRSLVEISQGNVPVF